MEVLKFYRKKKYNNETERWYNQWKKYIYISIKESMWIRKKTIDF